MESKTETLSMKSKDLLENAIYGDRDANIRIKIVISKKQLDKHRPHIFAKKSLLIDKNIPCSLAGK